MTSFVISGLKNDQWHVKNDLISLIGRCVIAKASVNRETETFPNGVEKYHTGRINLNLELFVPPSEVGQTESNIDEEFNQLFEID